MAKVSTKNLRKPSSKLGQSRRMTIIRKFARRLLVRHKAYSNTLFKSRVTYVQSYSKRAIFRILRNLSTIRLRLPVGILSGMLTRNTFLSSKAPLKKTISLSVKRQKLKTNLEKLVTMVLSTRKFTQSNTRRSDFDL